jgi:catechol 2,3-dioxygenase
LFYKHVEPCILFHMHNYQAPKELRIGHIHLKVSNLERSISFYREVLGFNLLFNEGSFAFLSVNNYHHHIGLNTWQSHGKEPGSQRAPGLYHFALNYPTQTNLGCIVKRLIEKHWPIEGSADHTSHLAVYTERRMNFRLYRGGPIAKYIAQAKP